MAKIESAGGRTLHADGQRQWIKSSARAGALRRSALLAMPAFLGDTAVHGARGSFLRNRASLDQSVSPCDNRAMSTPLYQQIVLEHNRAPRRFGSLPQHTHAADGVNPRCGDALRCELQVREGRIVDLRFAGESCAITTATASLLGELLQGSDTAVVQSLRARLATLWKGDPDAPQDPVLDGLNALAELRRYPARQACAELAFATIEAALGGRVRASTEASEDASSATRAASNESNMNAHETELQFRAAGADDVPAIVALVESAYRGDLSRQGWTTEADMLDGQRTDPEGVAALIAKPDNRIVLAARRGELVACAHLERTPDGCYFGMFSVRPTLQGGGVGHAVLSECERIARSEWRCERLHMTVIKQRAELIAWYERRGYARTGESKPFPYGDERYGLPKRPDLEFIVLAKSL
jgi:SUF system NifU family Fe-S assembly protein